jgi:hypothetical protein
MTPFDDNAHGRPFDKTAHGRPFDKTAHGRPFDEDAHGRPNIVSMFIFFSLGEGWLSRLIAKVCKNWSHMGVGFRFSDGTAVYFEAWVPRVRGPKPLSHLIDWVHQKPKRRLAIVELLIPPNLCERKYGIAQTYSGLIGYGELQLLAMWAFERFGKRWGWHVPKSPGRVVCSEYAARVLYPEFDLRDSIHTRFDEVTPGSAWNVFQRNWQPPFKITYYQQGQL